MPRSYDGRLTTPTEHRKWAVMEDFVLESLVGKVSYQMIALRLGRSPGAVQRRASAKGWSARANWAADRATRRAQVTARLDEQLSASEEELAAYL